MDLDFYYLLAEVVAGEEAEEGLGGVFETFDDCFGVL
jgi:hypothetical protein